MTEQVTSTNLWFALTFRLNPNSVVHTVKIAHSTAEYTVLDNVRVVEWRSSWADQPELLTIWIRKCNIGCLNVLKETSGKSPRFMLIGNPQGLFDEGDLSTDWEEENGDVAGGEALAVRAKDRMVRTHYVMYDSDRLLKSTDCHELFGRVADESWIYYAPGSLKAQLCVKGIDLAYKYLEDNAIAYKQCGKLIVALDELEVHRLETLLSRIVADFQRTGGTVFCGWPFERICQSDDPDYPLRLISSSNGGKIIDAKFLITCAGVFSDKIARLAGCSKLPKIVPFRGEYLKLKPEKRFLIKSANIYPVPDPRFPFLGVHFTPTIHGDVLLGPNAVLALGREAYGRTDFSVRDFLDAVLFRGMWKLMGRYAAAGVGELYRSTFTAAQVKLLQRYVPELRPNDVERGLVGIRAQALDADGNLIDDFIFDSGEGPLATRMLHVRNAPSPGATSSMAIAQMIVEKSTEKVEFVVKVLYTLA
uniref:L-2-hydroxyglutarate dehydrogenase, mitochondrial n=1 Tax=Globodera pallida TaxID=36090 RepID=A0A183C720_GLOPA